MHIKFKRKVLGNRKGTARRQNPFDYRVVREVYKHNDPLQYARLLKGTFKVICNIVFNAHGGKHNGEIVFFALVSYFGLARYLHGELIVLHA